MLQKAQVTVVSHRECYLREKIFFRRYLRPGVNFCAGGNGKKVCIFKLYMYNEKKNAYHQKTITQNGVIISISFT
jgi:hypothetical protein